MDDFTKQAIAVMKRIPSGKVTTYGFIAAAAGNASGARQVVRILHSSSGKHDLPWQRVVNRKQEISPQKSGSHTKQRQLLEDEGIEFSATGKIDFERFLWIP